MQAVVTNEDLPRILDRIANGEMAVRIAQEYGVSKQALHQRLSKLPDYKLVREVGIEVQLDEGLAGISEAQDLDSVRTREVQLRRLEWCAEREFPHRWGAKQEVTHQLGETFEAMIDRVESRRAATNGIGAAQLPAETHVIEGEHAQVIDK